jgi:hypothetical protein
MGKFLIASRDDSIEGTPPCIVHAESAEEALQRWQRTIRATSDSLREWVLELTVNLSFAEQFYLSSSQEHDRFNESAEVGTEIEVVHSRARRFFSERPDIGERYINYMKTGKEDLVDAEMLEFIALKETARQHGMIAVDMATIEVLE